MPLDPNTGGGSPKFGPRGGVIHPIFLANICFLLVVVDVLRACRQNENPESNMRIDCFDFINGTYVRRPGANCQVEAEIFIVDFEE